MAYDVCLKRYKAKKGEGGSGGGGVDVDVGEACLFYSFKIKIN
jgi:hypothetical protein